MTGDGLMMPPGRLRWLREETGHAWTQSRLSHLWSEADRLITTAPPRREILDAVRLLPVSRDMLRRVHVLGLAHKIWGRDEHAETLWAAVEAVARFADWNPEHFLDTAEMAHALGLAHDWMTGVWGAERSEVIAHAIHQHAFIPALSGLARRDWWSTTTCNWSIVCFGGLAVAALGLGERVSGAATELVDTALERLPAAVALYGPDGGYPEGVGSYWPYATQYLVALLAALESRGLDDGGLAELPGVSQTGWFPVHLTGPSGQVFDYYDGKAHPPRAAEMYWLAARFQEPTWTAWADTYGSTSAIDLLWRSEPRDHAPATARERAQEATTPPGARFRRSEVVSLRQNWGPQATWVGIKGGDNSTNHGDLDLGTFVLEMEGQRWAIDLGAEPYDVPGYWDGTESGARWRYYRKRAEGHNTLSLEPIDGPDQDVDGRGWIDSFVAAGDAPHAVLELSDASNRVRSWRRGVSLVSGRRDVLLQDEIELTRPGSVRWRMHTRADIEVNATGAQLTLTGRRLRLVILEGEGIIEVIEPEPALSVTDAPQSGEPGVRVLQVRAEDVLGLRLAVLLTPADATTGFPLPIVPLENWTLR